MIIDAKTVIITFLIIGVGVYFGLAAIRSFALSIAQENHDANLAMDMTAEARRARREREADEAATVAFAKVEPLLPASVVAKGAGTCTQTKATTTKTVAATELLHPAPSSGIALDMGTSNSGDEEAA